MAASGLTALFLLRADGLRALQTITHLSALPLAVVMLVGLVGLFKAFSVDELRRQSRETAKLAPVVSRTPGSRRNRLRTISRNPSSERVEAFADRVIRPSLTTLAEAFRAEGMVVRLESNDDKVDFHVRFEDVSDFFYWIGLRQYARTGIESDEALRMPDENTTEHARAEVFLKEGGQDYDVMGWSSDQIIHDVLDQYEKHLAFLRQVNRPATGGPSPVELLWRRFLPAPT